MSDQKTAASITPMRHTFDDIKFRVTTRDRYPEILELMSKNFYADEPMSKCINLVECPEACNEYALKGLETNLSIMAIDRATNNVLGVSLNGEALKADSKIPFSTKVEGIEKERFAHIIKVIHDLNARAPQIYDEIGSDCLFDIRQVTTDKHNRKGGLGTELLRRSVELARVLGFRGCKTEATGVFSQKAFHKLGFEKKAEYFYDEYVAADTGEKVFANVEKPHTSSALMTLKF